MNESKKEIAFDHKKAKWLPDTVGARLQVIACEEEVALPFIVREEVALAIRPNMQINSQLINVTSTFSRPEQVRRR
jgi:hypothetical protein